MQEGRANLVFLDIHYADIRCIQGLKNYVSIVAQGQRVVTCQTLRKLEEQLPQPPFVRVHKSFIISLHHLRQVDGNVLYVGPDSLPVGETYREALFKIIRERR